MSDGLIEKLSQAVPPLASLVLHSARKQPRPRRLTAVPTNRWFNDFVGNDPTGRAAVCGWGFLSCSWGLLVSVLISLRNWTLAKNLPRIYPTNSPKARRVAGRGSFRHRHVKTCCGHVPRYQTIPAQGKSFPRLRSVGSSLRRKAPRLEL